MANDYYHDAVKTALIKDGWTITNEPFHLEIDVKLTYHIDLAAQKWIIAEKEKRTILVEVKSFLNYSKAYDFHSAVGQYLVYKAGLEYLELNEHIYLAVPSNVYKEFFQKNFIKFFLKKYEIKVLPFNPKTKTLTTIK